MIYWLVLEETEPDRKLFLAMPDTFYKHFFDDAFFNRLLKRFSVHLIVYNIKTEKIEQWIKS